jgi:hypothetical protein
MRGGNSHPQTRISFAAERLLNGTESAVAPVLAARPKPELPEREGGIIENHKKVGLKMDVEIPEEGPDGFPAFIHVDIRHREKKAIFPFPDFGKMGVKIPVFFPPGPLKAPQIFNGPAADIVARPGVGSPRIA